MYAVQFMKSSEHLEVWIRSGTSWIYQLIALRKW